MPAAVGARRTGAAASDIAALHRDLVAWFRDDFAKYAAHAQWRRLDAALPGGRRARYRLLSLPAYLVEELPRLLDEAFGTSA